MIFQAALMYNCSEKRAKTKGALFYKLAVFKYILFNKESEI